MKIKILLFWLYMLTLASILVGFLGYSAYREAWILPPDKPANMEELTTWNELDLWRLMKSYKCNDVPMGDVPNDLKELEKFCNAVSHIWAKKYDESKYDNARKGATKLR